MMLLSRARCKGFTKQKKPCSAKPKFGCEYCGCHDPNVPQCRAYTVKGVQCCNPASTFSEFCNIHRTRGERSDTTDLRKPRWDVASMVQPVLEYRQNKDVYTEMEISDGLLTMECSKKNRLQLDHTVELHVIRTGADRVLGTRPTKQKAMLTEFLREEVVNEVPNLNFTTAEINNLKYRAFDAFAEDYFYAGAKVKEQGLFDYLIEAGTEKRIDRDTTGRIRKATKEAFEYINGVLAKEDEQPGGAERLRLMEELDGCMRALKLGN